MISVSDLTKSYANNIAVDHLSFAVQRGEVVGFLGPNGAGKTTTMKMIAGFLAPDRGEISINGIDMIKNPVRAKSQLGYLPEGMPLYQDMPVHAFLAFVARIRGFEGKKLVHRIAKVVESVRIDNILTESISTLSKGYRRRVGLAQSLLHNPEVLILDEPTDGLDPNQKDEVRALLESIASDKAIILSTHILEEVAAICNRVIIINRGRIVADATPQELLRTSKLYRAIKLQIPGVDTAEINHKLLLLKNVECVQYNQEQDCWHLVPKAGHSLIDAIWSVAESNSWKVRTIYEQRGELDDVFRQFTRSSG